MTAEFDFPPVTGQDVINCSFSSWYTKYHRLSPRARIIKPLPDEFLTFLKSDGIVLPEGYCSIRPSAELMSSNSASLISEIEEIESDTEVDAEPDKLVIHLWEPAKNQEPDPLADFTALLSREIALLNGSVVPKLNWSTPKVHASSSQLIPGRCLDNLVEYPEMSQPTRHLPPSKILRLYHPRSISCIR